MRVIDIGNFWQRNAQGKPVSVNAVSLQIRDRLKLNRYTLTRARDGELEKADIDTIWNLLQLCSEWAGREVTFPEIVREVPDRP
jgi:hypothetical protein